MTDTPSQKNIALAKRLFEIADHLSTHKQLPDQTEWSHVRKLAKSLMRAVTASERRRAFEAQRAIVDKDVMRSEMHFELVDREANAARVVERQRFLYERPVAQNGLSQAFDRAASSASFVQAALVALCPHTNPPSRGCALICNEC